MLLVDSLPALEPLLAVFKPTKTSTDTEKKPKKTEPWLHSQTLPLIHLNAAETRFFFPVRIC